MVYGIRELTEKEIRRFFLRYPGAKFAVFDGKSLFSIHDTRKEAEKELRRWEGRDKIGVLAEEMLDKLLNIGREYDIKPDEVRQIMHEA